MDSETLSVIAKYLVDELVGRTMEGADCRFAIDGISVDGDHLVFDGYDLIRTKPFKIAYTVDEHGNLHEVS